MNADGNIYATREPVPEEDRERLEAAMRENEQEVLKKVDEALGRLQRAEAKGLVL